MPIDQLQQETLFAWLRAKGVREGCPACGATSRTVGDIVAPPSTPDGGGTVVGGPSFLLVQIICEHCSYVMHFATAQIGMEAGDSEERDTDRESGSLTASRQERSVENGN